VVVLQEIFGVNADLRQTCNELAAKGFLALAPDLFWRLEPGVDLSDSDEAAWKKGFALYSAYDRDQGVDDVAATLVAARRLSGTTGKAGVMGFCLGGLMTFLTATRSGADAAVAYYGGDTEKYVGKAPKLATPLLMHLAEEDEFISKDAQSAIHAALGGRPGVEIYSYPGCNHAFARHGGQHYDAAAAQIANARTLDFLRLHLKGGMQ
jgi:carboxymethylenebutenolidase